MFYRAAVIDKPKFRSDIEGLRGVAVLLVVAYHAGVPAISGGFIGVDVFFVISGYVISALIAGEIEQSGKLDLSGFYARRARRLIPAAVVVLFVTVTCSTWFLSPLESKETSKAALAAALL